MVPRLATCKGKRYEKMMTKKIKRDSILYTRIQAENAKWIKKQMKLFGYSLKRGKSEFIDTLISNAKYLSDLETK